MAKKRDYGNRIREVEYALWAVWGQRQLLHTNA